MTQQTFVKLPSADVAAGGSVPRPPQIHGDFMYGHAFEDLDGHVWELAWMNPDAAPPQA